MKKDCQCCYLYFLKKNGFVAKPDMSHGPVLKETIFIYLPSSLPSLVKGLSAKRSCTCVPLDFEPCLLTTIANDDPVLACSIQSIVQDLQALDGQYSLAHSKLKISIKTTI